MRYIVLIRYTDMAARETALPAHRAYLAFARDHGIVLESGPFADGLGGMYILDVADEGAAHAFVAADPYTAAGMALTVRRWHSNRETN
jgi:uncharacterized protein